MDDHRNRDLHRATVCATCWHTASAHCVDGEELRECAPSCGCQQYEDAAKALASAHDAYCEKDAELASVETSYLEVCRILGAIYAADGHPDHPAPHEEVQKMARATMHTADRVYEAEGAMMDLTTLRPLAEYHEDDGAVLWWRVPVVEPPHVGWGPGLDDDFPDDLTHWSPLPQVNQP